MNRADMAMLITNEEMELMRDSNDDPDTASEVEKIQIDFINSNRVTSVISMAIAAIFIYFIVNKQSQPPVLELWLVVILCVDVFRLYATIAFSKNKANSQVNYHLAKKHIYLGTFLSGSCWGSLGAILIPVVDEPAMFIVIIWLLTIAMASTTTLSYIPQVVRTFVFLELAPLLIYLPMQDYLTGVYLLVLEAAIVILIYFLLKNASSFSKIISHMIELQARSKQHEQQLIIQSRMADQANNAKTEFLANMSHELRTPMHAILGFSSIGMQKTNSSSIEKVSGYFSKISQSGERLLHLLNNLLDLSKLEAGRMVFNFAEHDLQMNVNQVVSELTPLLIERNININVEPAMIDTTAVYDSEKITQVIRNLISNAIKFTPIGKSITINFDEAELYSSDEQDEENTVSTLFVSVRDQGQGIPEDELVTVFDKFVQSSKTANGAGGTGLGLSISKEIIDAHSGTIFACNSPIDCGAVITFSIPRIQKENNDHQSIPSES